MIDPAVNNSIEEQFPEGWHMVRFGDMAKNISKRVEPSETNLEIYVGLEHLDSDNLKIKRYGTPRDVAGQKLLVKKGQVIFGKRRAYQRKVAIAEWDCICSAHAMVLEENPETVLPMFLPFFMQSDIFMNRAVKISEGSLSPTIKWKTLSNQKFCIPTIEKQKKLLNIFKKINYCSSQYRSVVDASSVLTESIIQEKIYLNARVKRGKLDSVEAVPKGWRVSSFGEEVDFVGGSQPPSNTFEFEKTENNVRLLQIRDYKSEEFKTYIPKTLSKRHCEKEDVMIGRYGPPIFQILRGLEGSYNVALIKAQPKSSDILKSYLYYALKSRSLFYVIDLLSQRSAGQTEIDMNALKNYPFFVPPLSQQKEIVSVLDSISILSTNLPEQDMKLHQLINSLLSNQDIGI